MFTDENKSRGIKCVSKFADYRTDTGRGRCGTGWLDPGYSCIGARQAFPAEYVQVYFVGAGFRVGCIYDNACVRKCMRLFFFFPINKNHPYLCTCM